MAETVQKWWHAANALVALWRQRARERAELARMSEYELKDIGLGNCAARWEINKPFWRP